MRGDWPNHSAHLKQLHAPVSRALCLLILQGNGEWENDPTKKLPEGHLGRLGLYIPILQSFPSINQSPIHQHSSIISVYTLATSYS